jgi:hypothetical protein
MATSLLFSINKFVVLEYAYSGNTSPLVYSTNTYGFRKVINSYSGENTIVNKDNATTITRNTVDNTVVELDNGRYALLDNDAAFFYPNADDHIDVQDIIISPSLNVTYDKVKIHILSGYNFENLEGFIISFYARMNNDKSVRLCNLSHTKGDSSRLFFNPKPMKLAEFIYDKYIEFLIPSHDYMLTQQELTPNSTTNLSYYLTDSVYLANQKTIYCEFKNIRNTISENGLIFFDPEETVKFAFNSTDQFDQLVAKIKKSSSGEYFEYYAEWDGNIIEDFIFQLNSIAGNKFILIHEIRIIEQVGITFTETDNVSSIQTTDYDKIKRFRPILRLADTAVSFSIEYTARLYNTVDGRSIFKTSSLSSTDVNKYGEKMTKLNVGNITQPLKVYNKVQDNPIYSIKDNLLKLTNTKILSTFINNTDIIVSSDSDLDNSVAGLLIKINPFDNIFKFNLQKRDNPKDIDSKITMDLDSVSKYLMVFNKNDGSRIYIDEFLSQNFKKNLGELAFKINQEQVKGINNITNNIFYVITRNPDGIESVVFTGNFELDYNKTSTRTV